MQNCCAPPWLAGTAGQGREGSLSLLPRTTTPHSLEAHATHPVNPRSAAGRACVLLWQVEADSESGMEELLRTELHQNDKLDVGYLENGLRYVLLPNRAPPNRFEAHLEVHAGGSFAGGWGNWLGMG